MTADVRQLIRTKARTCHRHPRASVPRAARRYAGPAVDAPGQIANKDFSHRLFHFLACPMAPGAVLNIANPSFAVHLRHLRLAMIMATVAGESRIVGRMTGLAGRLFAFVAVIKRKRVLEQTRRSPACGSVARSAVDAELSAMDGRVRMTAHTLARRVTETVIDVTFGASHPRVLEFERKDGGVIKSLQAVAAIVTRETCPSHCRAMVRDKSGVVKAVTISARGQHNRRFVFARLYRGGMTGTAGERLPSVTALVARKTKAELIVRQFHKRCLRQAGRPSSMVRMTRGTFPRVRELAVQTLQACHLFADVAMALHAA